MNSARFGLAVEEHEVVARAASDDRALAEVVWNAVVGDTAPAPGSYAEAVVDTAPVEHAALLATEPTVAAWAFAIHWIQAQLARAGELATPFARRKAARESWATFCDRADKATSIRCGFGCDLSLAWRTAADVEQGQKISTEEVAKIAKLAGRMYGALRGACAKRVVEAPEEVFSVELGRDVGRLLPSEMAQLAEPLLEIPALYRIATGRAEQYAVRGTRPASRGPIVIALDESGSMHAQRRIWSKAAAIAVARVAIEEGRACSVVHYSTSTSVSRIVDEVTMMEMVRSFMGGGTMIGHALHAAVREVHALEKSGQQGADIILITDGVDDDTPSQGDAMDAAKAAGFKTWVVAIEEEVDADHVLRAGAAGYAHLSGADLADGSTGALFAQAA